MNKLPSIRSRRRSSSYLGTINNDAAGLLELKEVRELVKKNNKLERTLSTGRPNIQRVRACGRLGKNNPNAEKYKIANKRSWRNAYSDILKDDAATFDLYITTVY
jgi:hypothetical protein